MVPTGGLEQSWAALLLVVLLVACCVPLYRSMRRHMNRIEVPTRAEIRAQENGEEPADGAGSRPSAPRSARRSGDGRARQ